MSQFGPHFAAELRDAGLAGLPIAWTPAGEVTGRDALSPEQDAELQAVIDAHDPDAVVVPVPEAVTPRQARLALLASGLLDAVETTLAMPQNRAALITWEYALEIRRDDPLIATIGTAMEMSSGQIDDLFIAAGAL